MMMKRKGALPVAPPDQDRTGAVVDGGACRLA